MSIRRRTRLASPSSVLVVLAAVACTAGPTASGTNAMSGAPTVTGTSLAGDAGASGGVPTGAMPTGTATVSGANAGGPPGTAGAAPTGETTATAGAGTVGAGGAPSGAGGVPVTMMPVGGTLATAGANTGSGGAPTGMDGTFTDRTSAELLAPLSIGFNVGNSLDAPEGETAWGNPAVTADLLGAVASAGFSIVRIPVTWSLHTGAAPAYAIDATFLARVAEVVDYAIDAGLYAIINLHHDGADAYDGVEWLTLNDASGAVTEANNTAVRERFVALWTQISAHFAPYGEHLLFESMNEIHDGYDTPDPAYYDIVNDLNQTFVDTVRASGGNNAQRHLVVPGYNTNIDYTLAGFVLPTDPTASRLTLSVHYYDPWDFAGGASTNVWGSASSGNDGWGQEDHVVAQFDALKSTYVDVGVPVVIGEYGAVHQAGFEEYRRYYMEYVTKAAVDRGITPIYWDNGSEQSGAEAFGLFNRTTLAVLHPTILDAMMRAATQAYSLSDVAAPSP